jgi:hypothetical protein
MAAAAFSLAAWISAVFLLPLLMKSPTDRWLLAAGIGAAAAQLVELLLVTGSEHDNAHEPAENSWARQRPEAQTGAAVLARSVFNAGGPSSTETA